MSYHLCKCSEKTTQGHKSFHGCGKHFMDVVWGKKQLVLLLAAIVIDYIIITLSLRWTYKGHIKNATGHYHCLSLVLMNEFPFMKIDYRVQQPNEQTIDHNKGRVGAKKVCARHASIISCPNIFWSQSWL